MKSLFRFRKIAACLLAFALCLSALLPIGCGETPEETTPDATTPVVTPEASTPEATPEDTTPDFNPGESTPESTAPESTPEETTTPLESYNISYDLDGGMDGGNITVYNSGMEFTLKAPVKVGYDFVGWTGSGIDGTAKTHTVARGTEGDLTFKAVWSDNTERTPAIELDESYFGRDDGIAENPLGTVEPTMDRVGGRGEGVYVLKTIYTDIAIDATKDNAYSYGLHFHGDIPNTDGYYDNRETYFDVYLIRGQDGRIYVYVDVVDPDVVVNKTLWNKYNFYVDSFDIYIDYGSMGVKSDMWCVVADPDAGFNYPAYGSDAERTTPPEYKVTLTNKGYSLEFAFDNNGVPFGENDMIGLGYYINDANDFVSGSSFNKYTLKTPSYIYPAEKGYKSPDATINDAIQTSLQSASGAFDVETKYPEKTGDMMTDILSGAASVAVIYNEYATVQTIANATNLVNFLRRNGASRAVGLIDSNISDGESYDYEILVGMTDRELTASAIESIGFTEFGVMLSGNQIAVIGWNEEAAEGAYAVLSEIMEYLIDGGSLDELGTLYEMSTDLVGKDLPIPEGFDSVTDVGEGAYQIYKMVSTMDEYNAYLAALEAAGYKLHTTNVMGRVHCATYYNDDTVVNVQFANGDPTSEIAILSLRIVVEPMSNTELPATAWTEDASVTTTVSPSITMLDPHNLCLVIQLSNGHFVVVDSGNNGTQKGIVDFLKANAPDGKPVVEAWIFTHFHQDHIGGFVDLVGQSSMLRNVTIKSVIYNFPQQQVINTASASTTDMTNMTFWPQRLKALREKGATVYQARTGQKYYFGDAVIEILWTFEDIMPHNIYRDRSNPTCIGFSITIGGQKILVTGDSSEEEFAMAYRKYGDYLKSDFVQLSHHGQGEELFRPDQPDGGSTIEFYKAVNAPYVLNAASAGMSVGYGEAWAKENAEKVFTRHELGICTIPLPYDGGEFTSQRGQ